MFKHLAEFGGANNRETFKAATAFLRKNSGYTLEIPQNEYLISSDQAKRLQSAVMTGKLISTPEKFNRATSFVGVKDTVIRGNGSVISCGGITEILHLKNCENITVSDLTLRLSRPIFSTGTIEFCTDNSGLTTAVVRLDDECPVNITTPIVYACVAAEEFCFEPDVNNIKITGPYSAQMQLSALNYDLLGAKVGIAHAQKLLPAIHIENCKNITLSNVKVLSSAGDGLLLENSENIILNGFSFSSPFTNGKLLTGEAVVVKNK